MILQHARLAPGLNLLTGPCPTSWLHACMCRRFVDCYSACFHQACGMTAWRLARCFISSGFFIQLAGVLAWAATYPLMYKSMRRRDAASQPQPILSGEKDAAGLAQPGTFGATSAVPEAAELFDRSEAQQRPGVSPTDSLGPAKSKLSSQRSSSSGLRQRPQHAAGAGSGQGAAAKEDTSDASKQQQSQPQPQEQQPATPGKQDAAPLPLEHFGIYIFRTIGLAPTLHWVDAYANSLADRVNEELVVRVVCMPFVIHCLMYAVMARLRFLVSLGKEAPYATTDAACWRCAAGILD